MVAGRHVVPDADVLFNLAIHPTEWCDHGIGPEQGAVLSPVTNLPMPDLSRADRLPHTGPEAVGLLARADQLVALPQQFLAAVAGGPTKPVVDQDDAAAGVGHGDQGVQVERAQQHFVVAQGCFQKPLRLPPLSHVNRQAQKALGRAAGIMQRLKLEFDPSFISAATGDEQVLLDGTTSEQGCR